MAELTRSNSLAVQHPGQVLLQRCLQPNKLSIAEAATKLHVSRKQLSLFVNGHSAVSVLLAKKLELGTGISAQFWLSRQQKYDLHKAATLNVVAEPLYQYG